MDVFSNITFGLSRKNSEFVIKTKEMISMLGIEQLLSRKILSLRGQAWRAAEGCNSQDPSNRAASPTYGRTIFKYRCHQ